MVRSSVSSASTPSSSSGFRPASSLVKIEPSESAAGPAASTSRKSSSARFHPYTTPTLPTSRASSGTSQSRRSSGSPEVIDLTLDDDEDEDAPIPAGKREDEDININQDHGNQAQPENKGVDHGVELSEEQQRIFDQVVNEGQNVFLTGKAGTGKSVLIKAIIKALRKKYERKQVAVTATTGVAANNIGGGTIHSWAKIGLGKEDVDKLYGKLSKQAKSSDSTWGGCKVLILDEISMLDGKLFDKLEILARRLRDNPEPFGGIQLVLVGDFLQLPPVPDFQAATEGLQKSVVQFAFQSERWDKCNLQVVSLTKVFRQRDQAFVKILNEVRVGKMSPDTVRALCQHQQPVNYQDGVQAVSIYPKKDRVKGENDSRLRALRTASHSFLAKDESGWDGQEHFRPFFTDKEKLRDFLEQHTPATFKLELKIGAQVMLVKNLQNGLVNGSCGIVKGFLTREDVAERAEGDEPIEVAQPILSERERLRIGLRPHEHYESPVPDGSWPFVEFKNGKRALLEPLDFAAQNCQGVYEGIRSQVPLTLAWAISIHKSQGQTLERVRIAVADSFAEGMAYVALSRATSLDAVEIIDFNPLKVKAFKIVLNWMKKQEELVKQEEMD